VLATKLRFGEIVRVKAIWLIQLGTPSDSSVPAVRRYLNEFLTDPRMIDLPAVLRHLLVRGIIVPFRAPKSAAAYQKIWSTEGSPLLKHSKDLQKELQKQLGKVPVFLSMRYGQPSIADGWKEIQRMGSDRVLVVPLFPQYSSATNASIMDKVSQQFKTSENIPMLQVFSPFYDAPGFIAAMAEKAPPDLLSYDRILFSFHGYPERFLKRSSAQCLADKSCCDKVTIENQFCYRAHSVATAKSLAAHLKIPADKWAYSFQSRLGGTKWTEPYTDAVLEEWGKSGVKRIAVFCPSFVADCLETLEEIGMRERERFLNAGGQELLLVPCVNSSPSFVNYLSLEIQQKFLKEKA